MDNLLLAFYFFLPAGLANSAPVIVAKIPGLKKYNYPLDFYKKFKGKRVLGSHKTIRGIIAGVLVGMLTSVVLKSLYVNNSNIQEAINMNYSAINPYIFGGLLGLGSVLGDAIKSFFKRRLDIKPGGPWIPFDQIDYIVGGILFTYGYYQLELVQYVVLALGFIVAHFFSNLFAYAIKLKDVPY